ncbi:crotonyl-CoA carboxylase/reductase, partial [Streptomyces sp. G-G2]|nr:crotonyl-CoA carboxylase/reductase [Streptomyces sp. G-G2]
MQDIVNAVVSGEAVREDFAALALPEAYRAVTLHKSETDLFSGLATRDKDPRASIHLDEVPVPE